MLADREVQKQFAAQLALAVRDFFQHHEMFSAAVRP
jgi:hypothetical protein